MGLFEGLQIGKVTQLDGYPAEENRIQVKIPALDSEPKTVWARLANLYGIAESSGTFLIPEVVEYRHSNSPHFSTIKMPGIKKSGLVTMKKGVFKSDNKFWAWFNEIKTNTIKRKTLTIKLLDETGAPTMTWILAKAWPTEITGTDMKSDGNEVMVESIEFAHEGITIANV